MKAIRMKESHLVTTRWPNNSKETAEEAVETSFVAGEEAT